MDEVDCPVCGAVNDVQAEVKKAQVRAEGIPAVIRYEGDNQTIVWKHPLTDFTTGTQLIVHESQEAVSSATAKRWIPLRRDATRWKPPRSPK